MTTYEKWKLKYKTRGNGMYELRIKHLEEAHRAVNKQVDTLEKNGLFEDLKLEELKKQRLHLKDKLAILKHKQKLHTQE
jgi:uncharacterized protein YdcH (DUF465 family)